MSVCLGQRVGGTASGHQVRRSGLRNQSDSGADSKAQTGASIGAVTGTGSVSVSGSVSGSKPRLGWGLVLAGLVWLAGCASTPPASFYALSPLPEARDRQGSLTEGDLSLGIGPVTLPDFLDRPQLVDRSGANRLEVDEFQRWGGSLRADIVNILSENLAHLLGTSRVLILPAEVRVPVRYRLVADILRFEPGEDGQAHLKVRWALIDPEAETTRAMRESSFRQPYAPGDRDSQVAALSACLGAFSREVAATLQSLPRN